MKTTNKYNMPQPIVNVVSRNRKPVEGRLSVTTLINPPIIRKLKQDHWDELTEDASDKLWALLGQSVHYIIEGGTNADELAEEKFVIDFNGYDIVGVTDNYKDGVISDYKVTSVWSYLFGDKGYEEQLNLYAWMWEMNGFPVTGLKVHAILRDWQKSRYLQSLKDDSNYPPIPFVTIDVELWDMAKRQEFLLERISLFEDTDPPVCSPKERWHKDDSWAVKVKTAKRAKRVLDSEEEAERYIEENGLKNAFIEHRKGEDTRCLNYCVVKDFCPYGKEIE